MMPPSPASASEPEPWTCPRCGTAWSDRWLRWFVPYGATERVTGCEFCLWRDLTQPEVRANTIAAYGLETGQLAGMTLRTFRPMTPKETAALRAAERVAALWAGGAAQSLWLWSAIVEPAELRVFGKQSALVSGCGTGKTHLAVALAKQALDLSRTLKFVTEGDLVDGIKASYDAGARETQAQIVAQLSQSWLLVLDDVGTADVKALGWYQAILYGIVDKRYRESRPVVMTTNLPPAELAERLGPRTMSRLSEMGVGVHLDGPDRRRMK